MMCYGDIISVNTAAVPKFTYFLGFTSTRLNMTALKCLAQGPCHKKKKKPSGSREA